MDVGKSDVGTQKGLHSFEDVLIVPIANLAIDNSFTGKPVSPVIHHQYPVGHPDGFHQVVGDEQSSEPGLKCRRDDQILHAPLQRHVQGRKWLVEENEIGSDGQSTGDRHTLTHPARQFDRVFLEVGPFEFRERRGLKHSALPCFPGYPCQLQRERDVLGGRAPRHEARILKNHGVAAIAPLDPPLPGIDQASRNMREGGFTASRWTDEANYFTRGNGQRKPREHGAPEKRVSDTG